MKKPDDRQIMVGMNAMYKSLKTSSEGGTIIQNILWMASQLSEEAKKELKDSNELSAVLRSEIELEKKLLTEDEREKILEILVDGEYDCNGSSKEQVKEIIYEATFADMDDETIISNYQSHRQGWKSGDEIS